MKGHFFLIITCFLLINGHLEIRGQEQKMATDSLITRANNLSFEGYAHFEQKNYREAEEFFFESIKIWNRVEVYDEYKAFPYFTLGSLYLETGEYNKSIEFYMIAESILKKSRPGRMYLLASLYTNIGNFYFHLGDYKKADAFLNRSISILESIKEENPIEYFDAVFGKAQSFYYQGLYEQAIRISKEYLNDFEYGKLSFSWLIGDCYINLGVYAQAISILNKEMQGDFEGKTSHLEALLILSKAYLLNGDLAGADSCLAKAKPLLDAHKGETDPWTIYYYDMLGQLYMQQAKAAGELSKKREKYLASIKTFDQALLLNSANPEKGIPFLETTGDFITPTQVRDIFINRAKTLKALGDLHQDPDDPMAARHFYDQSLNTWKASIDFLHNFRISFLEEESKLSLSESQKNVYLEGFKLAGQLYSETGLAKYLQNMLYISESGKAATFLASLNAVKAKNFGGLPDSLLQYERDLNSRISSLKQKIFTEKGLAKPDSFLLSEWENSLFELQKNYDELIFKYERDYPDYYNFKYRSLTITNDDIVKKLKAGQVLIEYLIDEPADNGENGHVYCLAYSSRGSSFHSVEITGNFARQIETVIEQLTNKNVGETNLEDFCNYVSAAKYLHSVLIEPLSIVHSVNDLIIIPDGKLAYLPFDALLTETVDTTRINYRELPYLVYDYNISYSYSATLHFEYFRSTRKQRSNILAFAPEYMYENIDPNKEAYSRQMLSRAVLNPLPGAVDEVRRLKDIHGCTSFIGKDASETNFKELAANYDILHMAMHTIMNDSIPMFSKLVFSRPTDTINDGFLNTQEIYNMKLNARLAVLSACNTGTGKLRTGEGVMSMARAFLYSGCPSIIMTMWEVEDRVSADIMIAFYKNIFKGYSKPEALRKAKISHIQNADPFKAHPYFWQAYIVVGDPSPLKFNNIALVSILVFSIILIVFVFFGKKILQKKRQTR